MDFGSLWGSPWRPFWPQKSMKKHPSSKDPLQGRPMDAKRLQNDAKWSPKASKMEQKWNQNEAKRQPTRVTRIKKPTKFECKSGFQLGLQESSNEVWSYRVSKNMAVQVSLWGPAVTPALRAQ